ncbi:MULTISPECIES: FtsK/SpoIIIE domain-containing protein [Streptococcus]|uniref:Cell division protein FtsK n=1 Tax=Streptococcus mitis TaxID=28037 RepID=A0A1X1K6P0_STRMT|nr:MULTISPECIES: FtsK/SpoIIIE domain-containing protein [Streptococcus]EHD74674.1 ftsK/SpoIIIE family protein [Streptococcus pneumoniae GA44511]EHE47516.1 ftsK/SpoIIIE family protein [Streptococcus pneumoniae GA54644]EHE34387.1 ftsK/SpoIIIE family protein [Streptococcus pneumoniae GA47388]EHZ45016.1 ftsK/SpoIIIE family protein [Streptococcus pneumoniae GA43257]EJH10629.1 ftsK/SpoIIIE family protein [Streptococcus pneumoniae GA19998]
MFRINCRVSLCESYILSTSLMKNFYWASILSQIFIFILLVLIFNISGLLLVLAVGLEILIANKFIAKLSAVYNRIQPILAIRERLLFLLESNNLFISSSDGVIVRSVVLDFSIDEEYIGVYAHVLGDNFSNKVSELDVYLSACLNLNLEEKIKTASCVKYTFRKYPERRISWEDTLQTTEITISADKNCCWRLGVPPHVLISGSTRSGKTVMIENLVAQYLTLGAEIKLLDPKNGDLSWLVGKKLEDRLGYKVVYNSPFQISGALREAVLEMNRRFQVMADNPDIYVSKGKVLSWADVKGNYPLVVVLDEGIAFKTEAETSKEGKKAYEEAMSNLGSLLVKSRQASIEVIVGLQRASSDFIPTYMRQNFGVALLLGATTADSDSCRMMFSSQEIDYKTCGIAEGYCQIDGVLPTPKFVETPFKSDELDFEAYFDEACDRYMRMRNERN